MHFAGQFSGGGERLGGGESGDVKRGDGEGKRVAAYRFFLHDNLLRVSARFLLAAIIYLSVVACEALIGQRLRYFMQRDGGC